MEDKMNLKESLMDRESRARERDIELETEEKYGDSTNVINDSEKKLNMMTPGAKIRNKKFPSNLVVSVR
jgi:hypothetical protein